MKFNKFCLKKFISIFTALAILITSISMSAFFTTVGAVSNSDTIDFEGSDASAIVEGNDAFSITGQDSQDKYYFYAKNNTADILTITFDDIGLEAGKQYTLDFDVYTLRVSKDDNDVLLGVKMYGDSECVLEKQIKNTDICEDDWANYHASFTAKEGVNKLDFSIYTIGKVFIDNFVLIDENGKETAIDAAAACEATELKDHFSMATLYDIAYEEPDIIDGYLKATVPVNSNTVHNEGVNIPMNLSKPLDKGRYTVSVDLKFTSVGSCRDSFCASVAGDDYSIIQQKWLNAVDITLNKYNTYTFELDLTPEHNKFRLNVYQGCTAYIDNLVLIDSAGIEVVRIDFDEPVNFEGSAYEQKGIAKTQAASAALYSRLLSASSKTSDDYAILIDNSANTGYGQLYLHEVGMPYDTTYPIGNYTIKFDFYALEIGSSKNIVAQLTKPDWSGDAFPGNGQKWLEVSETIGEWQTISFDITTVADGKFPWFYIGAGMKGYFDNYQIIDKGTGETVLDFSPVEADLGKTSKEICTVVALPKDEETPDLSDDYAVLVDNSAGTGYGQLYLHEVGMPYDNTYAAGDYTIKFDFYALEIGSSKNIVAQLTKPDWSGDAFPGNGQKWLEVSETIGEWQTISFDITTVADGKFPWFYIGAGMKGYFDNYQIIDKGTGETVLDFSPVEADLGKTSKEICTVVALPKEDDDTETSSNDVLLVDTTSVADDGLSNKDFWFNELGMKGYGDLPNGTYTIQFDVCALKMPTSKNLFHFRTSKGSGSSKAGFWKPDLTIGEWTTTSSTFTVTDDTTSGNHILYVYGGFKGYVDNLVILDSKGNEVAGTYTDITGLTVPDMYKDYLTIETITTEDDEETETNDVLLIDTTSVADDGLSNKNFWFNELGMPGYGTLPNGTYTVQFDVCAIKMPTSKNLFHFRTSKGSGSSQAGFWKPNLTIGEWTTTSSTFTVTDDTTSGNHILYVYGGFKGYVDNLKILDASGNEVAGTYTDMSGLTVPNMYKDYLKIETITTEDDEEIETNDVLFVDTTAVDNGTPNSFWFNELGMAGYGALANGTYTIQFDVYPLTMPTGGNLFHYRTGSGNGPSSDAGWWKPGMAIEEWTTTSNTFTVTDSTTSGNHILFVYGGFKGYIDNLKILDASGNEVSGTYTDMSGLTVPDMYKDYLKIKTIVVSDGSDDSDDSDDVLSSGMNIAILRGRAGKNGASIKLGGAKSPLTIKSNTTYKLSFRYYQANPTNSGILNLFGIDTGFDNDITYFKKNNSTGWTTGTVFFTTGNVTDASADWFEIILNPNAWVYFDDFKVAEQEIDNNKAVSIIDFEQKDDTIYPDLVADNCTFGQTTKFSGTSNGGNGYFCASNAREYTNDEKNSNQKYQFGGIKLKSNTTYRVSIDYYVAKQINDYAFAIGYSETNTGSGSGDSWQIWGNNKKVIGWNTESFVFTTGEVVPNAGYINLVIYDTPDSSTPRVMYFDNLTFTELYRIDSTSNNSDLGTVSSTITVEAGSDSKVVANPYAGVTFEGWYEYGDLVSTDEIYRIKNVNDNHKLVAHFSGTPVKPEHIVQGFEDYDLGDILYEYYEIVDDPKNVLEGKQSLHVKPDKIEVNADHSIFFPLVSSVEAQLKEDTEYDVYIWVKPTKPAESTTYFQIVDATGIADMSDLLTSPGGTGMQLGLKPSEETALEVKDGWCKYLVGTITKSLATRQGFGIQVCKFHAFRAEGASIDDLYIDMVEVVERVPDYANLKFTENLFNEISNSNFEEKVTDKNWAPLINGLTVEKIEKPEYDWQGKYQMKFDAAKSGGQEYVRVIPIGKPGKNYTFAAWTKLSAGSDITVGLYKNGNYETFENIVNGKNGTLPMKDDGKWNRVSFTFNSGDYENAYLVIKGTKGVLELDMVELFIATRGYTSDPNSYGINNTVLQMTDPIAFPDVIRTETTYIENDDDDTQEDTYIEDTEEEDTEEEDTEEEDTDDEKTENTKKRKKKRVVKVVKNGGTSPWVWVGVGAGALVVAAAVTIFVILFKKRKQTKKGAK